MPATMIGMLPGLEYETADATMPPGSRLYLFSDGVFEVLTASGERWSLSDFEATLLEPGRAGVTESERLYQRVKQVAAGQTFEDDFSLMVVTFQ
jgi:sigma-B regulation protein RsbU (phosphoserine phosphatase)